MRKPTTARSASTISRTGSPPVRSPDISQAGHAARNCPPAVIHAVFTPDPTGEGVQCPHGAKRRPSRKLDLAATRPQPSHSSHTALRYDDRRGGLAAQFLEFLDS